ncbi:hypothetical protein [Pedobacter sp. NJ-S-72]
MKTLQECKEQEAKSAGYDSWKDFRENRSITDITLLNISEIYADQFKPRWIPVSEMLPENRSFVMVSNHTGEHVAEFKHNCFFLGLEKMNSVTHWQGYTKTKEMEVTNE